MRSISFGLFSLLCATCLSVPAQAAQYLTGGIGGFDIFNSDHASTNFNAEWRGNTFYYGLLPTIGAEVNTNGGVYGYVGLNYDWEFAPNWILTPNLAVGAYHQGGSVDLGGWLEFREGIELDYRMYNQMRIGARFEHVSNADIYDRNPGEESLMATFSIPISNF